jgi:hypothetical protein
MAQVASVVSLAALEFERDVIKIAGIMEASCAVIK